MHQLKQSFVLIGALEKYPIVKIKKERGKTMNTVIQGIAVTADLEMPHEETVRIVSNVIKEWDWDGKKLGKIELIRDGAWIRICSYEQPSIQILPYI